jgi:hypothetical protein
MTFFASAAAIGSTIATSVAGAAATALGVGGLSAGAAGVAGTVGSIAGTAIGGGLAGAALGAGTSALTGGDVGKGALMGGVTGLAGGAVGGVASAAGAGATASGAIGGAAGGAAGSAAGGEDPLKGALIGGVTGAAAGSMMPESISSSGAQEINGIGKTPLQAQAASQSSPLIEGANIPQSSGAAINNIPTSGSQFSNLPASDMSGIIPPSTGIMDKGLNLIKDNPAIAMQLGGAAMNMMGGTSSKQQSQAPATASIYDPIPYIQQDIPRTTVPQYYYAVGGSVTDASQQGQMNPIVARAMQQIQQAQPQPALQPQQTPAPQGIMGAQPTMAQPIQPVQQPVQPMPQAQPTQMAAAGGMMRDNLGGYSHGGIAGLTRGPGDGVSDSIPAEIGDTGKQPARLADGEFVIPARIVSELGNGSTEAGAKSLQAMVDRVQKRRSKTVGKGKVAVDSKARKGLLA